MVVVVFIVFFGIGGDVLLLVIFGFVVGVFWIWSMFDEGLLCVGFWFVVVFVVVSVGVVLWFGV